MNSLQGNGKSTVRAVALIIAAIVMAAGIGYAGSLIGAGFAAKAGNAITITGSAKVNATSDNVVWTLNAQENAPTAGAAVKRVESDVVALTKYLTDGGVTPDGIQTGAISTNQINQYINGNFTGKILAYQANQNVVVRSKDVEMIQKLSNGIGVLLQTGINVNNYGPQFYISSLNSLRPKLLADAMRDAQARAQAITSAVGGKVGAVLSVTSGPFQVTTPDSTDTSSGGYYDTTTIPKTVTATVSVSFKVSK